MIAHAAAGSKGFELIDYFPSPETLVGAGFASWKLSKQESVPAGAVQPEGGDRGVPTAT